jgi:uncharacterized membrane protein
MKVKYSVVINLPIEEIFAYVADFENLADWSGVVIAIRKKSPGAICVGTTLRSTIRFLGRWLDMVFEVIESEPNRYLTVKSISGGTPCLFCYQFDPAEDGGTNISVEAMVHFAGIVGLAEPVVTRAIRRQLEHDLLTLKDMLEASVSTSRSAD